MPWGAIGGAIGGVLVLIGAGVLYCFYCRKPRPSAHQDVPQSQLSLKSGPQSLPIHSGDGRSVLAIPAGRSSVTNPTEEARGSNHQPLRRPSRTIRRPRQPPVYEEPAHESGGDLGSPAPSSNSPLPMRQRSEDMDFNEWAGASKE